MDQVLVIRHKVLHEERSVRSVAREFGVSRNTVQKYLSQAEPIRQEYPQRTYPVRDVIQGQIDVWMLAMHEISSGLDFARCDVPPINKERNGRWPRTDASIDFRSPDMRERRLIESRGRISGDQIAAGYGIIRSGFQLGNIMAGSSREQRKMPIARSVGKAGIRGKSRVGSSINQDAEVTAFLLKIELQDVEPRVARLMVIPPDSSLWFLHTMIQEVMGWQGIHQYAFYFAQTCYLDCPEGDREQSALNCTLRQAVMRHGPNFRYVYDFGDGWEHNVTVLDQEHPRAAKSVGVECLDGCGACPVEDVGGPRGYREFLIALADPRHPEHRSMKAWLADMPEYGPRFNPLKFDRKKVNGIIAWLLTPNAKIPG